MYVIHIERCRIIDAEIRGFKIDDRSKELLVSIPGIGKLTAVMLMSMIIDINRFQSADKMCAFFGMAPEVRDNGQTMKHGKTTKKGDPMMRGIVECTVFVHSRACPESTVARIYERISSRSKKQVALMAAANKL